MEGTLDGNDDPSHEALDSTNADGDSDGDIMSSRDDNLGDIPMMSMDDDLQTLPLQVAVSSSVVNSQDVLCGRGKLEYNHRTYGNVTCLPARASHVCLSPRSMSIVGTPCFGDYARHSIRRRYFLTFQLMLVNFSC